MFPVLSFHGQGIEMSKVVVNEAMCFSCGAIGLPGLDDRGMVACKSCGSVFLSDLLGNVFEPEFAPDESKTYRVNSYGPELIDRRKSNRRYPMFKDRRNREKNYGICTTL